MRVISQAASSRARRALDPLYRWLEADTHGHQKMSYLILGLGALLSLGGAWVIVDSYGIIQVERGWAGVIAGTTALSCGIVTIGVGFILHRLTSLYAFLKAEKGLTPLPAEFAVAHELDAALEEYRQTFGSEAAMLQEAVAAPAAAPSAASSQSWLERTPHPDSTSGQHLKARRGRAGAASQETSDPDPGLTRFSRFSLGALRASAAAQAPASGIEALKAAEEQDTLGNAAFGWDTPAEPPKTGSFADSGQSELPEPAQPEEPTAEAQRADLERSLDQLLAQSEFRMTWPPETAQITEISVEENFLGPFFPSNQQSASDEPTEGRMPTDGEPEPAIGEEDLSGDPRETSEDPLSPAPPLGAYERPTIVGQYESGGTSYVMYADGSIEARSERGVLHFDSMAELKAFMEGQA